MDINWTSMDYFKSQSCCSFLAFNSFQHLLLSDTEKPLRLLHHLACRGPPSLDAADVDASFSPSSWNIYHHSTTPFSLTALYTSWYIYSATGYVLNYPQESKTIPTNTSTFWSIYIYVYIYMYSRFVFVLKLVKP